MALCLEQLIFDIDTTKYYIMWFNFKNPQNNIDNGILKSNSAWDDVKIF